jgi:hypothetical protein
LWKLSIRSHCIRIFRYRLTLYNTKPFKEIFILKLRKICMLSIYSIPYTLYCTVHCKLDIYSGKLKRRCLGARVGGGGPPAQGRRRRRCSSSGTAHPPVFHSEIPTKIMKAWRCLGLGFTEDHAFSSSYDWFLHRPLPSSPVSYLDRRHTGRLRKRDNLLME